jgi:hypothetical protein
MRREEIGIDFERRRDVGERRGAVAPISRRAGGIESRLKSLPAFSSLHVCKD